MILIQQTLEKYGYNIETLGKTSVKFCILKCDYCHEIFERTIREVNRGNKKVTLDACPKRECRDKKSSDVYQFSTKININQINDKRTQTSLKKYGVDNAAKLPEKFEKRLKTTKERYGVEFALQSEQFQKSRNQTMLDRYGTTSSLDASGRKEEIICKIRSQVSNIVTKGKQTCLKKYGVDNAQKVKTVSMQRIETCYEKYGNNFFSDIAKLADRKVDFNKIIEITSNKNYQLLSKEEDYQDRNSLLSLKCLKHECEFRSKYCYLKTQFNQCPKCRNYQTSRQEKEIFSFINEIYDGEIVLNARNIIDKELDIYISEKKFAIEHHGLYWHSELYVHYKSHFKKFKKCEEKGISLFQFYADEWRDKKEICKSMIRNKLGLNKNKIYARNLKVVEIEKSQYNLFLGKNHLMGAHAATKNKTEKCFALVDDFNNIACCIVAKRLFSKQNENNRKSVEIVRFGTLANTSVIGGFSRLLKYIKNWAKQNNYDNIITYSDCRYSTGNIYSNNGFKITKKIIPNYYYTNFVNRYNKYPYRAKNGVSEPDIVAELDLYKIYDAGKMVWVLNI